MIGGNKDIYTCVHVDRYQRHNYHWILVVIMCFELAVINMID